MTLKAKNILIGALLLNPLFYGCIVPKSGIDSSINRVSKTFFHDDNIIPMILNDYSPYPNIIKPFSKNKANPNNAIHYIINIIPERYFYNLNEDETISYITKLERYSSFFSQVDTLGKLHIDYQKVIKGGYCEDSFYNRLTSNCLSEDILKRFVLNVEKNQIQISRNFNEVFYTNKGEFVKYVRNEQSDTIAASIARLTNHNNPKPVLFFGSLEKSSFKLHSTSMVNSSFGETKYIFDSSASRVNLCRKKLLTKRTRETVLSPSIEGFYKFIFDKNSNIERVVGEKEIEIFYKYKEDKWIVYKIGFMQFTDTVDTYQVFKFAPQQNYTLDTIRKFFSKECKLEFEEKIKHISNKKLINQIHCESKRLSGYQVLSISIVTINKDYSTIRRFETPHIKKLSIRKIFDRPDYNSLFGKGFSNLQILFKNQNEQYNK